MPLRRSVQLCRGFASDALSGTASGTAAVPATIEALKNISSEVTYDERTPERFSPRDPSKKAFTYLVLTGGRYIYASALRILALKLIQSRRASSGDPLARWTSLASSSAPPSP